MASSYKSKRNHWIIAKLTELPRPGTLVDFGAGNQIYKSSCSGLTYIPLDNDAYKESKSEIFSSWDQKTQIVADLNFKLEIPSCQYDHGLCTEVFEHLVNPVLTLSEMIRVLKVGGRLIITCPSNCQPHMEPNIYNSGFFNHWYTYWAQKNKCEIADMQVVTGAGVMCMMKKLEA